MTDQDLEHLRRLFEVMERLRAPGGCPWDRVQTHSTLIPFLLEETYETIQAIEEDDPEELAEELGDLLVEVAMHAAIALEAGTFDIGTVARRATEKMVGRHPQVFSTTEVSGVEQVLSNWEELKRQEKPQRGSALDGIPRSLPALALADSIQRRQQRAGSASSPGQADPAVAVADSLRALAAATRVADDTAASDRLIGELLFAVVALARQRGVDPEGALRRTAEAWRRALRQREVAARADSEAEDGAGGPKAAG
jgi:MazG family protein